MTLSQEETERVWEGLYNCEVRSLYFGHLSLRYQKLQTFLTWCSLVLSCGAAGSFVSTLEQSHPWAPSSLALLSASVSLYSVVSKKERKGIDSSSLGLKYEQLAHKYDLVFRNMRAAAPAELAPLEERRIELSQLAHGLADKPGLMEKSQDQVRKLRRLK